jgi:hypothetical protein
MRATENKMQRRIFRPKGKEVIGGWRKLYNKELYDVRVLHQIKEDKMEGTCSTHGRDEKVIKNFSQKT